MLFTLGLALLLHCSWLCWPIRPRCHSGISALWRSHNVEKVVTCVRLAIRSPVDRVRHHL